MAYEQRDQLFKDFARAFFKKDLDALYQTVTDDFAWHSLDENGDGKIVTGRDAVAAQLSRPAGALENVRFNDVVYHHTPEASFMTFRITAVRKDTQEPHEEIGVERYTFRDGKIAIKDVYRKRAGA